MANDVFNIASDIEVSIYTYPANTMIWGVGRWGKDNWASTSSTQGWQAVTCETVSVQTDNGLVVTSGYTRPVASSATIIMTGADFDPFTNSTIHSGTPVRVRVRPNPDTAPSTWVTLWQGTVTDCSVFYAPKTWVNTITLRCEQNLKDVLNYVAETGITVTSPCYAADFIDVINATAGSDIRASGAPSLKGYELDGLSVTIPVNFGNLLNILTDTNLGAIVYKPLLDATALWYYAWPELENRPTEPDVIFESEVSVTANRAEFTDIQVTFDTSKYVNTLRYYTAGGVDDAVQNAGSVDIVGNLEGEVTTRHFYATDADAAAAIAVQTIPTRSVDQITAPIIKRSGQLNTYLLRDPFDTARILVDNDNMVMDESYYIINVSYDIGRDFFNGTFDLWIGR
jgi:hypothetical protein